MPSFILSFWIYRSYQSIVKPAFVTRRIHK